MTKCAKKISKKTCRNCSDMSASAVIASEQKRFLWFFFVFVNFYARFRAMCDTCHINGKQRGQTCEGKKKENIEKNER